MTLVLLATVVCSFVYAIVERYYQKQVVIEAIKNGCEQRVVAMYDKKGRSYTALAWVKKEALEPEAGRPPIHPFS